jgi:hypothetical protein
VTAGAFDSAGLERAFHIGNSFDELLAGDGHRGIGSAPMKKRAKVYRWKGLRRNIVGPGTARMRAVWTPRILDRIRTPTPERKRQD